MEWKKSIANEVDDNQEKLFGKLLNMICYDDPTIEDMVMDRDDWPIRILVTNST